jgi:hypothetical protein
MTENKTTRRGFFAALIAALLAALGWQKYQDGEPPMVGGINPGDEIDPDPTKPLTIRSGETVTIDRRIDGDVIEWYERGVLEIADGRLQLREA